MKRRLALVSILSMVILLAPAGQAGAQTRPPQATPDQRGQGPAAGPMPGGPGPMPGMQGPGQGGPMAGRPGPRMGRQGRIGFGMRRPGMGGPGPQQALAERLGLTQEQKTKLHQLSLESRKVAVRTRADLEIKQMELHELLSADNPDRAQTDRKLREIADLRYTQEKSRVDERIAFQQLLTPEQRTKLRQFRESGPGPQEPQRRPGPPPM